MTDPTFTTRAALEEWIAKKAREGSFKQPTGQLAMIRQIKRVMIAHSHLEDV